MAGASNVVGGTVVGTCPGAAKAPRQIDAAPAAENFVRTKALVVVHRQDRVGRVVLMVRKEAVGRKRAADIGVRCCADGRDRGGNGIDFFRPQSAAFARMRVVAKHGDLGPLLAAIGDGGVDQASNRVNDLLFCDLSAHVRQREVDGGEPQKKRATGEDHQRGAFIVRQARTEQLGVAGEVFSADVIERALANRERHNAADFARLGEGDGVQQTFALDIESILLRPARNKLAPNRVRGDGRRLQTWMERFGRREGQCGATDHKRAAFVGPWKTGAPGAFLNERTRPAKDKANIRRQLSGAQSRKQQLQSDATRATG